MQSSSRQRQRQLAGTHDQLDEICTTARAHAWASMADAHACGGCRRREAPLGDAAARCGLQSHDGHVSGWHSVPQLAAMRPNHWYQCIHDRLYVTQSRPGTIAAGSSDMRRGATPPAAGHRQQKHHLPLHLPLLGVARAARSYREQWINSTLRERVGSMPCARNCTVPVYVLGVLRPGRQACICRRFHSSLPHGRGYYASRKRIAALRAPALDRRPSTV